MSDLTTKEWLESLQEELTSALHCIEVLLASPLLNSTLLKQETLIEALQHYADNAGPAREVLEAFDAWVE